MAVELYSVLDVEYKPLSKVDRGHTITVVIKDKENRSRDELYIDGYHIHPSNWCYNSKRYKTDRSRLRYRQRPTTQQNLYLAGMLAFDTKRNVGIGIMYFGKAKRGVHIELTKRSRNSLAIVGSYKLHYNKSEFGQVHIHPKGLIINGKKANTFNIRGNRVSWKGMNKAGCITQDGFLEFSENGRQIIKSSFGAVGNKLLHKLTSEQQNENLDLSELLNMDPFDSEGTDVVQQSSMNDFYLFIQYYMRDDWRQDFLSPQPIVLAPYMSNIAHDDGAGGGDGPNKTYYQSLSVPYLSYALSDIEDHDDVGKLNYIRADKMLKKLMKDSDVEVYNRHSGKLYEYHWKGKFPGINKYLTDQATTNYDSTIDKIKVDWKNETRANEDALGSELTNKMLGMIDDFAVTAKNLNVYWAYEMLYYLSDPDYINRLRFIILSTPAAIDDIQRENERYCSVMTVLDPSNYFTQQFAMVLELFKLTDVIPKEIDIANIEDLDWYADRIMREFVNMYENNPDPAIAEAAQAVADTAAEYGWDNMIATFTASSKVALTWPRLFDDLSTEFFIKYGNKGIKVGQAFGFAAFAYTINLFASEMVDWNDLTPLQQAEFITSCARGSAFLVQVGVDFISYAPRMWEQCKTIFYKSTNAISSAAKTVSSAFSKWIIKSGSYVSQSLKVVEEIADNLLAKGFAKFKKFAGKFSEFISTRVGGVLALAGVIFSAIDLAHSNTPLEYAMNSMFLLSSILEVVAIVAKVAISKGIMTIGGSAVGTLATATIASVAGGLAIAAVIVGVIIMLVMAFKPQEPPDPIRDFVQSSEVSSEGLYMAHETSIEYFAVQMDDADESKEVGVTFTTDGRNYMHVDTDGNITFTAIDVSYHTVFTVAVDEVGITTIFTKTINGEEENVLHLTVNDDYSVNMQRKFADDEERKKQLWIVDITGNVVENDDEQLESATFTIYNVKKKVYIHSDGSSISVDGARKQDWIIALEYMQPDVLAMKNITINSRSKNRSFNSYLAQSGSTSGRRFTITPALPDFLEFDDKTGAVKQKEGVAPRVMNPISYTLGVSNPQGSANNVSFTIEVIRTT